MKQGCKLYVKMSLGVARNNCEAYLKFDLAEIWLSQNSQTICYLKALDFKMNSLFSIYESRKLQLFGNMFIVLLSFCTTYNSSLERRIYYNHGTNRNISLF